MNQSNDQNNWISFSDLMTALMVIFMFISISYILEINKKQEQRDAVFKKFKSTKDDLYKEINAEFETDFRKWQVSFDKDLSIKFTNPELLFQSGETTLKPYFKEILISFFPRYFNIVKQEKYKNEIAEIRIEGHTDTVPALKYDSDSYMGNIILSQLRSAEVLKLIRNTDYFQNLNLKEKQLIQFWLTANGLSFGRTLDSNKQLTIESENPVDNNFSRRLEIKIITESEIIIENVLKEL